jgi:alkylhydroperoxidase family enzyme
MPRVPYKPHDVVDPCDLVQFIRARRGGSLLNLDRVLLHSPPFAKGWNLFLQEVRTELKLSTKLRELATCVVAVLNGADYEFGQHAPQFLKAGGTTAQVDALYVIEKSGADASIFDVAELAVIQLTVEMTRMVKVSDATFAAVKAALPSDQDVVEIVGVIATYNMVSRFLVAMGIEPEN